MDGGEGSFEEQQDENDDPTEEEDEYTDNESAYGSEDDEFAEFGWLEQIDGVAKVADTLNPKTQSRAGYCDAKLIRRNRIRSFYSDMEEPSRETGILAFELFDRYGLMKKVFQEHVVKKGSGIWGTELDDGDLLLLEYVSIHRDCRRQGLGRKLVTAVLEKARTKSTRFFAVVCPGWLNREIDEETKGASEEEVKKAQLQAQASAEAF